MMKKIKKVLVNIAKKNQMFRIILRFLINLKYKVVYKCYSITKKIDNKTIIFESFVGNKYACSPKAIYEEMIKDNKFKNFKFYWSFKNPKTKRSIKNLERSNLVKRNSKKFIEICSTAKYIITNSRLPDYIIRRKGQVYLQCWHGTPLKKLGYDLTTEGGNALNSLKDMQNKYKTEAKRFTHLLSPSKFTTEKLSKAFNLEKNNNKVKILEVGYPRNDFLFKSTAKDKKDLKKLLNLPSNKKVILYAPTWRDNQHEAGVGYTYDLGVNFDNLKENLNDEFVILFRTHYFVANKFNFDKYKDFVINVSEYEDIVDLYTISDLLITDYSSVFFDYANLKRPIIFYMYDLEKYKNEIRGFYLDLNELPGKITTKEDELINEIKNIENNFKYDEKYITFNKKYNYLDEKNISKKVINKMIK